MAKLIQICACQRGQAGVPPAEDETSLARP